MKARSFSHVGITVSDFNRFVQFYWDVFGCPLVGVADTPPDRVRSFFRVDHVEHVAGAAPSCKIGWVRVPGGAILEIFEFQPQLSAQAIPWNRVGLTHFSFNVRNTQKWYDYLVSKVTGEVVRRTVSDKGIEYVPDAGGRGTVRLEVPAERRGIPCLGEAELAALVDVARRIEEHYGSHQDVEWAIARKKALPESLIVLQSRPVTTLPERTPTTPPSAISLVMGTFGAANKTQPSS